MTTMSTFAVGAGTGAAGLYIAQRKMGHGHGSHHEAHSEAVDMSSSDSVHFGNSTSANKANCACNSPICSCSNKK